ncbi:MAG: TetR/AcrR family transcriptional regulator [Cocleimonas sp.]
MPYLKRDALCPEPIDCRILSAALDLFVENGFHSVSVHDIKKNADVSIGSIYNHFGGKEGIAKALNKHLLNEMDELIDDVMQSHDSPEQQCKEIIIKLLGYTETHTNIIAFIFHAKHTDFLPNEPLICDASPFIRIREIISQGMKQGEFIKTDPFVATSSLFGGVTKMIQLRLDGLIDKPLTDYTDMIIKTGWHGVAK